MDEDVVVVPGIERGGRDLDKRCHVSRHFLDDSSAILDRPSRPAFVRDNGEESGLNRRRRGEVLRQWGIPIRIRTKDRLIFNIYVHCHWKIPDVLLVPLGLLCATSHRASLCLFRLERFKWNNKWCGVEKELYPAHLTQWEPSSVARNKFIVSRWRYTKTIA